jgi:hypothetical protein
LNGRTLTAKYYRLFHSRTFDGMKRSRAITATLVHTASLRSSMEHSCWQSDNPPKRFATFSLPSSQAKCPHPDDHKTLAPQAIRSLYSAHGFVRSHPSSSDGAHEDDPLRRSPSVTPDHQTGTRGRPPWAAPTAALALDSVWRRPSLARRTRRASLLRPGRTLVWGVLDSVRRWSSLARRVRRHSLLSRSGRSMPQGFPGARPGRSARGEGLA